MQMCNKCEGKKEECFKNCYWFSIYEKKNDGEKLEKEIVHEDSKN